MYEQLLALRCDNQAPPLAWDAEDWVQQYSSEPISRG